MQPNLYVFHSPEVNIVLGVLSFFNFLFFLVFLSNVVHLGLDILEHYAYYKHFRWIKQWSILFEFLQKIKH